MLQDVEVFFEVGLLGAVEEANLLAGEVLDGGLVEVVGEKVGAGDAGGGVGGPAGGVMPFAVRSGGVDVDADEDYVLSAEGIGDGALAAAALLEGDVGFFGYQELGVEAAIGEF